MRPTTVSTTHDDKAAANPGHRNIRRILVVRPNHRLGNLVLITASLEDIARCLPGAEVDLFVRGKLGSDLFAGFMNVRTIWALPRHATAHPLTVMITIATLRQVHYDVIINTHPGSRNGRAFSRLARGAHKIGTSRIERPDDLLHESVGPCVLVRENLGLAPENPYPKITLPLSREGRLRGIQILNRVVKPHHDAHSVCGIFTHATGAKLLPAEWWREFLAHIEARSPRLRVIEILPAHGTSAINNVRPTYYTTNIVRLAEVLSALRVFVSGDCGVMHLAAAAGTPTVALFCHDNRPRYAPRGKHNATMDTRRVTPEYAADRVAVVARESRANVA